MNHHHQVELLTIDYYKGTKIFTFDRIYYPTDCGFGGGITTNGIRAVDPRKRDDGISSGKNPFQRHVDDFLLKFQEMLDRRQEQLMSAYDEMISRQSSQLAVAKEEIEAKYYDVDVKTQEKLMEEASNRYEHQVFDELSDPEITILDESTLDTEVNATNFKREEHDSIKFDQENDCMYEVMQHIVSPFPCREMEEEDWLCMKHSRLDEEEYFEIVSRTKDKQVPADVLLDRNMEPWKGKPPDLSMSDDGLVQEIDASKAQFDVMLTLEKVFRRYIILTSLSNAHFVLKLGIGKPSEYFFEEFGVVEDSKFPLKIPQPLYVLSKFHLNMFNYLFMYCGAFGLWEEEPPGLSVPRIILSWSTVGVKGKKTIFVRSRLHPLLGYEFSESDELLQVELYVIGQDIEQLTICNFLGDDMGLVHFQYQLALIVILHLVYNVVDIVDVLELGNRVDILKHRLLMQLSEKEEQNFNCVRVSRFVAITIVLKYLNFADDMEGCVYLCLGIFHEIIQGRVLESYMSRAHQGEGVDLSIFASRSIGFYGTDALINIHSLIFAIYHGKSATMMNLNYVRQMVGMLERKSDLVGSNAPKRNQGEASWAATNTYYYLGMIHIFMDRNGSLDLPLLVCVSLKKLLGFKGHKEIEVVNAYIYISVILRNRVSFSDVVCDLYNNKEKAFKQVTSFVMDPTLGKTNHVQFPQHLDGIGLQNQYANWNIVFLDMKLEGFDGLRGIVYILNGCRFSKQTLCWYDILVVEALQLLEDMVKWSLILCNPTFVKVVALGDYVDTSGMIVMKWEDNLGVGSRAFATMVRILVDLELTTLGRHIQATLFIVLANWIETSNCVMEWLNVEDLSPLYTSREDTTLSKAGYCNGPGLGPTSKVYYLALSSCRPMF